MATIITAIALVIFLEGLIYGGFPNSVKKWGMQVQEMTDNTLRIFGIVAMIVAIIIIWLMH